MLCRLHFSPCHLDAACDGRFCLETMWQRTLASNGAWLSLCPRGLVWIASQTSTGPESIQYSRLTSLLKKRATQVMPWIQREVVSFTRTGGGTMHTCADYQCAVLLQRCSSVTYTMVAAYRVPLPFGPNNKPPAR